MHVPWKHLLAAHSFGIGSVWINQLRTLCDDPEVRALLDEFEIPSDHVVYGMAALGYPADATQKGNPTKSERSGLSNKTDRRFYR